MYTTDEKRNIDRKGKQRLSSYFLKVTKWFIRNNIRKNENLHLIDSSADSAAGSTIVQMRGLDQCPR